MEFLTEIISVEMLFELLVKGSLVLIMSFSLVFMLRRKSSTLKHFLLSASLISLLFLPVFSTFSGGWKTRLLPAWTKTPTAVQAAAQGPSFESLSSQFGRMNPIKANAPLLAALTEAETNNGDWGVGRTRWQGKAAELFLLVVWSVGMLFLAVRIALGLFGAFKLTRQGKPVTTLTWRQLLTHFLEAVSIKRKIILRSHHKVRVPLTWGHFKPVILVPDESGSWTREECSSALFHELSHIKRGDFLIKILARLSCALYWFNPLGWFALHLMKMEQEKACDELVLKAGVKPSTYVENLLAIKNNSRVCWNPPSAALGAVGKSQLNERLLAILKQQLKPKEVKMKTKILLSTIVIFSLVVIGLARPAASAAQNEKGMVKEEEILAQDQPEMPGTAVFSELQGQNKNLAKLKEGQVKEEKKQTTTNQEKTEQKNEERKKISWVTKDGKTILIYITLGEGDEVKEIQVTGDIEISINKDPDKKSIHLILSGEKLELKKNEQGEWTIEAGEFELKQDEMSKAVKLNLALSEQKMKLYTIKLDKFKDGKKHITFIKPHLELKVGEKLDYHLSQPSVALKIAPHMKVLKPGKPLNYTIHLQSPDSHEINAQLEEIREKLRQVREGDKLADEEKEKMLQEIEEMLKELSEKLREIKEELKDIKLGVVTSDTKKLGELSEIEVGIATDLKEIAELKDVVVSVEAVSIDPVELEEVAVRVLPEAVEIGEIEDVVVSVEAVSIDPVELEEVAVRVLPEAVDVKEAKGVLRPERSGRGKITISRIKTAEEETDSVYTIDIDKVAVAMFNEDKGELQILIKAGSDKNRKERYDEAISRIKKKLSEGYTVESEIDEGGEVITLKISGVPAEKGIKLSITELIKMIKEELSLIK